MWWVPGEAGPLATEDHPVAHEWGQKTASQRESERGIKKTILRQKD